MIEIKPGAYLDAEDPLARFLTSQGHFRRTARIVREAAFLPPGDLKLSVCQIKQMTEDEIWTTASLWIPDRPLYGRADFRAEHVYQVGLGIDPDDHPPNHANIVGWPGEKFAQKSLAQQLAASATLCLPPSQNPI